MAEKIDVTVSVAKETYQLGEGLVRLVAALKPVLKDGFQYSDIPALITAVIAFAPAFKGIELLPSEMTLEPGEFAMAGAKMIADMVAVIRTA